MKEYLKKLPKEILDLIYLSQDIACYNNMSVYLVGGFVRDLLLGVPNLDLDIVLEGDGIKFAEDLASHLKAKLIRHRRFGTATLMLKPQQKIDPSTSLRVNGERSRTIDVTSARKEFYPQPAHLPVVSKGNLRDDLSRRDFTINAMALSINSEDFGKLIDFFRGKEDLSNKKIRVLHHLSFVDDPTRILRGIRFEQRYNFKIEPTTLERLKEAVKLKMLDKVEPQRIRDDLILILKEKYPLKEIKRLSELVGFDFISPRLSVTKETYNLMSSIERQMRWFQKVHHQRRAVDAWLVYFMCLIDSVGRGETVRICRRFAFRKGEEKRISSYKRMRYLSMMVLNKKEIKPSEIFSFFEPYSYEVILYLKAKYKNRFFQKHIEDFLENYNHIRLHITGDDLHKLGVPPGPAYQKILAKILKAKLNGLVKTKNEELGFAENLIKKSKLR